MTQKFVYRFDEALPPDTDKKALLGGKGAGLAEMTRLGIPVPPGFTITTEACVHFRGHDGTFPDGLEVAVREALAAVEQRLERRLGDEGDPLLLSVRSGARVSMPGMMDTILNLGLTDETVEGLARVSGDRRFAFDAYRRFIQMYGDVVMGVAHARFEEAFTALKVEAGDPHMADADLDAEALESLVTRYKAILEKEAGEPFPNDVHAQLWGAIRAVFRSWDNTRAVRYRKMQGIPGAWGTACNVQSMVFGNKGEDSGSGVVFTRNPSNGEPVLYGEYLPNAQGEDVVAGIRTPLSITEKGAPPGREAETLERRFPEVFAAIREHCARLEKHFGDMQDVEFTVEQKKPFILQTRTGKRTGHAAVRIAIDLVHEGLVDRERALCLVDPASLDQLLHARLPHPDDLAKEGIASIASGLPASPGAATGKIVFDADEAERMANEGQAVVLVRRETSPEDIHGMKAAEGILTATGGMTSHAAVVARGLGKCCVAGASSLHVDYQKRTLTVRSETGPVVTLGLGDVITLDGTHGRVYQGALEVQAAATLDEFDQLMGWADEIRRLGVRANADTPRAARVARSFGAEGIGLCRTEHMFFAEDRLGAMRAVALAASDEERARFIAEIEPMLEQDFEEIFEAMDGCPVTIRLLDWPLHEFLPREEREMSAVADKLGVSLETVRARTEDLHEMNPMLGHRGVRVGLTFPEIYRSQSRAILRAAVSAAGKGIAVAPEIMIPVVALGTEVQAMRAIIEEVGEEVLRTTGTAVTYKVGTMIELPRACLTADALAAHADFFSFGTNDLTQTTFGLSRDDAGRFLPVYLNDPRGLLLTDPFASLDTAGVGALIRMAVDRGRSVRSDLSLGLCGEHGGDPASIAFCEEVGLSYVSCSPPRLPIARLAAAQAKIRSGSS